MNPPLIAAVIRATEALVRIDKIDAGRLERVASDEFRFTYLSKYLARRPAPRPLSLAMALSTQPYTFEHLPPFFDNLLFEGSQLRDAEAAYGLSRHARNDRFSLLLLTGQSHLSAVEVLPLVDHQAVDLSLAVDPLDNAPTQFLRMASAYADACAICLRPHSTAQHRACQQRLWGSTREPTIEAYTVDPQNTFRVIVPGQSISGAQRKALFHADTKAVLSRRGRPTHIIKPEGDYPEMPANEHLTMVVAENLKFQVPPVGLYQADGLGLLYVVRRFDDAPNATLAATEDMAQLAGELAEDKGRGTLEGVANLIRLYASSAPIELAEFFRRLVFCFVAGNGDMHLKNWSMSRVTASGLVKLAPVYDFLNVRASFAQERVEMILPMGGKQTGLERADFTHFAGKVLQINEKMIGKILTEATTQWPAVFASYAAHSALSAARRERYLAIVDDRAKRLR